MYWIIVIFCLGILVALHELGHYAMARATGMKVHRFSVGFGPALFSFTSPKTGTVFQLGMLPLGGFVQILGMNPFEEDAFTDPASYQRKPVWQRALVILAGPLSNYLITLAVIFGLLTLAGMPHEVNEARVGTVTPDSPAAQAGLRANDRILEIDGTPHTTWDALVTTLRQSPEQTLHLMIERDGRRFFAPITPKNVDGIGLIGITMPTTNVSLPPGEAAAFAWHKSLSLIENTLSSLAALISGKDKTVQAVGPPGIVKMGHQQLATGAAAFLSYLAYISLMLFLFNLLPIPALDGGRTLFLLFELITRKPVNRKFDAALNTIFFLLLMGAVLIVSIREIFFG
ncbi:MAG: site-2 protease family protein [Proteobacteria bacterium]|nr:site-2 protease family protein [Pseudomonadota bacterium]